MSERKYKRASVKIPIPIITESHSTKKLRTNNERLIRHIEKLENVTFGIKNLFNKNNC